MPPSTPVPTACCARAPGPVLIASGTTASTNASEVITTGRNRWRAARVAASTLPIAPALPRRSCSAYSTIRIAFLAASPKDHHHAHLEVDIIGHAAQEDRRGSAHQPGRHDGDHRQRQRPAFIQRHQAQEDKQQRQRKQPRRLRTGLLLLEGAAGPAHVVLEAGPDNATVTLPVPLRRRGWGRNSEIARGEGIALADVA